ncbi:MAG: TonB-dependent receptor [Cyclobacteriaceae bacterium]|nr:TonB-dependent receptor [Cyclobacteriaceae bacterium]
MTGRFVFSFLTMVSYVAIAQNNGTFSGRVTDAKTGDPIPGVTIRLEGTERGAISDLQGFYLITGITPKTYSLTATSIGYKTRTEYNVVIRSGGNPELNIKLEEQINELAEVTVTVSPFEKLEETPLSIQRLSREEIATYPGGNNDIAKVVQSLPGVSGSIGGFRNDIIIRGGAPNENIYFLDGIEIPTINHFSTQGSAGGPVGLLNVSFFEGVTLSSSSFGAQYDNVLSGVLQFDQRNGNRRDFQSNIRVGSSEAAFTLEGPLAKKDLAYSKTSFILSVRRSYLQLLFKAIGLPFLPDYWDYQYKFSHQINEYNEVFLTGVGSVDDMSINVPEEYDENQQAILDQIPVISQWTTTSGITWKKRFSNKSGFMTTTISTNILTNDFSQYQDNENQTGRFLRNKSSEKETKFRYSFTRFFGSWSLNCGTMAQQATYSNTTENLIVNYLYNTETSFWKYGFFSQVSGRIARDRIGLSVGFRNDANSFLQSGENLLKTFSPRMSFSYRLDEQGKWTIQTSAGRYFKLPPYTILGFKDQTGKFINQSSGYIQSDHLAGGLEFLVTPSARLSLEAFYKKYRNYPISLSDSVSLANLGGDFSVLGNEPVSSSGLGRTYGLEFLFQKKFTTHYYSIVSLTLYRSEFSGLDPKFYLPSAWDSGMILTLTGGYKFGENWELSTRVRYMGRTPYAPVNETASLATYPALIKDYNRLGETYLDPFNQTDLRIDKKWNMRGFTLDIFVDIQNLFAQQLPSPPSYGLRRDATGQVTEPRELVKISSPSNSQILPSLGLVLDF